MPYPGALLSPIVARPTPPGPRCLGRRWPSRSSTVPRVTSGRTVSSGTLVGSGVSSGRSETHAARQPAAAAPATSAAQSSPTWRMRLESGFPIAARPAANIPGWGLITPTRSLRSEEHTSELQSRRDLVCRLLLEKKKNQQRLLLILDFLDRGLTRTVLDVLEGVLLSDVKWCVSGGSVLLVFLTVEGVYEQGVGGF